MFKSELETTSLNLRVCLISCSYTVKRFQSFLIEWRRLLKNSSNSSLKLSLMKIMWLRRLILCLLSWSQIDWFKTGSRSWISFSEVSISCFRLFWKSSWSRDPRGTTGCNKCVECRQRAQIFSESFKHRSITSSKCIWHFSTTCDCCCYGFGWWDIIGGSGDEFSYICCVKGAGGWIWPPLCGETRDIEAWLNGLSWIGFLVDLTIS